MATLDMRDLVVRLESALKVLPKTSKARLLMEVLTGDVIREAERLEIRIDTLTREETEHHRRIAEQHASILRLEKEIEALRGTIAQQHKILVEKTDPMVKVRLWMTDVQKGEVYSAFIPAIKAYRNATECGLAEAKSAVEHLSGYSANSYQRVPRAEFVAESGVGPSRVKEAAVRTSALNNAEFRLYFTSEKL